MDTKKAQNPLVIILVVIIVIALLVILYVSVKPSMTGRAIDSNYMPSSYCGDKTCDENEDCNNCMNDCGQCRLKEEDISVETKWGSLSLSSDEKTKKCIAPDGREVDYGDIRGTIRLTKNINGNFMCKVGVNLKREAGFEVYYGREWSDWGYFSFGIGELLNKDAQIEYCCYSDSPNPDFCKIIYLPAYC